MIDWLNPSDDVLEARRIGYEERDAEVADEITRLRAEVDELRTWRKDTNLDLDKARKLLNAAIAKLDKKDARIAELEGTQLKFGTLQHELMNRIAEAEALINYAALEIMTTDQLGRWAGVRAWIEDVGEVSHE